MEEENDLDAAAARLMEAVEAIEAALGAQQTNGEALRTLKEQLHYLERERARLLAELEAERQRGDRLEAANDEVSARLDRLSRTLKPKAAAES